MLLEPDLLLTECTRASESLLLGLENHVRDNFPKSFLTDIVIRCNGNEFNVHKNIVCWQCDFFKNALDTRNGNGFKESTTGVIHMDDDPIILVRSMLQFFYTKQYSPIFKSEACDPALDRVNFQIEMYAFAEKYHIKELYSDIARHFAIAVESINLRDPVHFREHAVDLIRAVYTSTGRSAHHLRDVVTAAIFQRSPHRLYLLHSVEFVALADEKAEIWKDFLMGVLGLVPPNPVAPCSCKGSPYALFDKDRLEFFCQDVPTDRRFWTTRVLRLTRPGVGDTDTHTPAHLSLPVLVEKMNELRRCTNPSAFWKRWVRALLGVQCNPKLYRCKDGCGEVFEWALPTNAARDNGWPCKKCLKVMKTIDEWEDCVDIEGEAADDQGDREAGIATNRWEDCAAMLHDDRDVKRPQKRKKRPMETLSNESQSCRDDYSPRESLSNAKKRRLHNRSRAPVDEFRQYRFRN